MDRITSIHVSSKRSLQIKGQYFTIECGVNVDLTDLNDIAKQDETKKAWDFVNNEVDEQLMEVQTMLKG